MIINKLVIMYMTNNNMSEWIMGSKMETGEFTEY